MLTDSLVSFVVTRSAGRCQCHLTSLDRSTSQGGGEGGSGGSCKGWETGLELDGRSGWETPSISKLTANSLR